MRIGWTIGALALVLACSAATPRVTAVTAQQRYPWNGLVDIVVTLSGTSNEVADAGCAFAATNSATRAALSVVHVTRNGTDTRSGAFWTRRYVWDAGVDLGTVRIADIALSAEAVGGVQLWQDGPYWAECNLGASTPEGYGYYFWWGDTKGFVRNASNNGWVSAVTGASFSFTDSICPTSGKSDSQLQSEGYIDATGNLVTKYDAATAHLGAPWRMPTTAEFDALEKNCTATWTTRNGVFGRLVTGQGAFSTRNIFLPAAGFGYISYLEEPGLTGYYWSASPRSDYPHFANCLYFTSDRYYRGSYVRSYGQSVRPLREFVK